MFGEVTIIPKALKDIPYFQNSKSYLWIADKSSFILLLGFVLGFYKIIFSHWISRVLAVGGVIYAK